MLSAPYVISRSLARFFSRGGSMLSASARARGRRAGRLRRAGRGVQVVYGWVFDTVVQIGQRGDDLAAVAPPELSRVYQVGLWFWSSSSNSFNVLPCGRIV